MIANDFRSSTWKTEAGGCLEFEASPVYRLSSKTASTPHRNHGWKTNKQTQTNKQTTGTP